MKPFDPSRATLIRLGIFGMILLLLIPAAGATLNHSPEQPTNKTNLRQHSTDITFITTQGGSANVYQHAGLIVAVHTETSRVVWKNDKYRRYMDVDPLDEDRVLFVAGQRYENGTIRRFAVVMNWRNGTELQRFEVPGDTHDVDYLDHNRYVIADKENPSSGKHPPRGRVYIFNASTDEITWEYTFINHFPPFPEAGGKETGYTHLNDVDSVDNGTAFLVSPRNFDRVMEIDRSTKEIRWTLGEEDNYDILYEQHNPVLLQRDPLTVLVADSENDRVIEYQRTGSDWEPVWVYNRGLRWPRDADRLPNGNTLITDTANSRVIEVTPDRRIVWEFSIERGTYDAERLQYGDEPAGPSMTNFQSEFDGAIPTQDSTTTRMSFVSPFKESYNKLYQLIGIWILPPGAGAEEFIWTVLAVIIGLFWVTGEAIIKLPLSRIRSHTLPTRMKNGILAVGGFLGMIFGIGILILIPVSGSQTSYYAGISIALFNTSLLLGTHLIQRGNANVEEIDDLLYIGKLVLTIVSGILAGTLIIIQFTRLGQTNIRILGIALLVSILAMALWIE